MAPTRLPAHSRRALSPTCSLSQRSTYHPAARQLHPPQLDASVTKSIDVASPSGFLAWGCVFCVSLLSHLQVRRQLSPINTVLPRTVVILLHTRSTCLTVNLCLLAKPLVAVALLSSLASCSTTHAAPTTTGTYTRNGVATPCQVAASTRSGVADYLKLRLTPTAPQRNSESVFVSFGKPSGTPTSAYELSMISYAWKSDAGPLAVNYFSPDARATLTQLNSKGYSGTFSATSSRFTSTVITASAFTNVQL